MKNNYKYYIFGSAIWIILSMIVFVFYDNVIVGALFLLIASLWHIAGVVMEDWKSSR